MLHIKVKYFVSMHRINSNVSCIEICKEGLRFKENKHNTITFGVTRKPIHEHEKK